MEPSFRANPSSLNIHLHVSCIQSLQGFLFFSQFRDVQEHFATSAAPASPLLSGALFRISFLCSHLTSAIIVWKEYPLVNKSNIVSPHGGKRLVYWSGPQGCQNLVQFHNVLKQIVPGRGRQRAQHYLTHPAAVRSPLCALPVLSRRCALLFARQAPPPGTSSSPASVSDILTRSHKTCHWREEGRQMPESLNPLTKRKQTTPEATPITHNHVSAARHTHTHTHACMLSVTCAL